MRTAAPPFCLRGSKALRTGELFLACAVLVCFGAGCGSDDSASPRRLDPQLAWYGDNRTRLDDMIVAHGRQSARWNPARHPIAVFDFDNTVVKNDVGDATFTYMLAHDAIIQPPEGKWRRTSPYMTDAAGAALDAACAGLAAPGSPLPTAASPACATEVVTIYQIGKTTAGQAAWEGWNRRRINPGYAWVAQLLAGHTPAEIRAIAQAARAENLANPPGTVQTIGTYGGLPHWIRYYEQVTDLIATLEANGIDVWIVTASPELIVQAWAPGAGVAAERVIGIRTILTSGTHTYDLAGCGDVPDGSNDGAGRVTGNSMIPYIDGKRCWIKKVIYGDDSAAAMAQRPPAERPIFGAGDSVTDLTFLEDATALRLVINRNNAEVMCRAYHNADGAWLVNPMFLDPKPQRTEPYPCSATACVDARGVPGPCLDADGEPIPDQADTVF